jgi:2-oxoglutarate ferredoxin oxidoreductase subunit alpha
MMQEIAWKIGGQQGEGIESAGELLALALAAKGYHLYGYRVFSSRIRGGHTDYQLRIGTKSVAAIADHIDLLIALDQETIVLCSGELSEKGLVLADQQFGPVLPNGNNGQLLGVPLTRLAEQAGSIKMRNVVALGVTLALLGRPVEEGDAALAGEFSEKGDALLEGNHQALRLGWEYAAQLPAEVMQAFRLADGDGVARRYLTGNETIAQGALTAGVKLMAAYPITPASEIMEIMVKELPLRGGVMVQTEDEIAACMMAIGANYAGSRAFTATSGPGFSLMAESIGLAGMTETPLVVVDVQRGGPSTGLPSKHEQSDILAAIHSTHGEAAKIVMAPDTLAALQSDTVTAFNLAETYQCPVVLLSDMQLSLGNQTLEEPSTDVPPIRRGKLVDADTLPDLPKNQYYKRYQVTSDGISPRVLPGTPNGIHHVTGLEHDETGRPFEGVANRIAQMEKRLRKLHDVVEKFPQPIRLDSPFAKAQLLLISLGGANGAVKEAAERLRQQGIMVNQAQIRLLQPFPSAVLQSELDKAEQVVVVEHNAGGQLAQLIQANCQLARPLQAVRKFDGNPFRPAEIATGCREVLK